MTNPRKTITKAFVGSASKKSNKKGISLTKRSALFGLVGIAAFSVIGGFGWQKWQERQLSAKAAAYTNIPLINTTRVNTGNAYLRACKTAMEGGDWRVKLYGQRPTNTGVDYSTTIKYVTISAGPSDASVATLGFAPTTSYSYLLNSSGYGYTFLYTRSSGWKIRASLTQRPVAYNALGTPPVYPTGDLGGPTFYGNSISVDSIGSC